MRVDRPPRSRSVSAEPSRANSCSTNVSRALAKAYPCSILPIPMQPGARKANRSRRSGRTNAPRGTPLPLLLLAAVLAQGLLPHVHVRHDAHVSDTPGAQGILLESAAGVPQPLAGSSELAICVACTSSHQIRLGLVTRADAARYCVSKTRCSAPASEAGTSTDPLRGTALPRAPPV